MSSKYVIGRMPELAWVAAAWRENAPGLAIIELALEGDDHEGMVDLAALAGAGEGDSAFVVGGAERLNMRRLALMGQVKSLGLSMPPLLCRGAVVAATASIGENCFVGAGAVVGPLCRIGYNTVVGAGALVGSGTTVGNSVFIDDGVQIGRGASIAAHVALGLGVVIGHGVDVGKFSIVDKPGVYAADIGARTFIHASHDRPIVVVGQ